MTRTDATFVWRHAGSRLTSRLRAVNTSEKHQTAQSGAANASMWVVRVAQAARVAQPQPQSLAHVMVQQTEEARQRRGRWSLRVEVIEHGDIVLFSFMVTLRKDSRGVREHLGQFVGCDQQVAPSKRRKQASDVLMDAEAQRGLER